MEESSKWLETTGEHWLLLIDAKKKLCTNALFSWFQRWKKKCCFESSNRRVQICYLIFKPVSWTMKCCCFPESHTWFLLTLLWFQTKSLSLAGLVYWIFAHTDHLCFHSANWRKMHFAKMIFSALYDHHWIWKETGDMTEAVETAEKQNWPR